MNLVFRPLLKTVNFGYFPRCIGTIMVDTVKNVDIDKEGKFKYILIHVQDPTAGKDKLIVRGYKDCNYHADIYDKVTPAMESLGLKTNCLGGGRILHTPSAKTMTVFGYSTGFGMADHSKAVEILKGAFDDYNITWTNEGY